MMEKQLNGMADKSSVAAATLRGLTTTLTVEQIGNLNMAIRDASAAMGENANVQIPMIIKGIKQLNPAILDNIGVNVRLDEINKRIRDGYYGVGKEINETTQQHAIYTEIMKQTAKYQGLEADLMDTTKGRAIALEANIKNLQIAFGGLFSPAASSGLNILTEGIKGLTSAIEVMQRIIDGPPQERIEEIGDQSKIAAEKIDTLTDSFKNGKIAISEYQKGIETALHDAVVKSGGNISELIDTIVNGADDINHAVRTMTQYYRNGLMTIQEYNAGYDKLIEKFDGAKVYAHNLDEVLARLHDTMNQPNNEYLKGMIDYNDIANSIIENVKYQHEAMNILNEAYLKGMFSVDSYSKAIGILNDAYKKNADSLDSVNESMKDFLNQDTSGLKFISDNIADLVSGGFIVGAEKGSKELTDALNRAARSAEIESEYQRLREIYQVHLDIEQDMREQEAEEYLEWLREHDQTDQEMAQEHADNLFYITHERLENEKKAHDKAQKEYKARFDQMHRTMTRYTDILVDQMMQGRIELSTVFKSMARDFTIYFINQVLDQIKIYLIPKLLSLLSIFDKPANDRFAAMQGKHFMGFFISGIDERARESNLGNMIGSYFSPNASLMNNESSVSRSSLDSGRTININFYGPVTDREFVRSGIVPIIEEIGNEGYTTIVTEERFRTGESDGVIY
jgi:hypothetical protein